MRPLQRFERPRRRAGVARVIAFAASWCALAGTFETDGAAGAHSGADAAEKNSALRGSLREQIQLLLVEGNERIVIELLKRHLDQQPDDALMQYNAACIHARLENVADAEKHLRLAIKNGFLQFSIMKRDPDLALLRDRSVFQSIMAARDAADNIITDRRNAHWLKELGDAYRLTRNASRKIDVITALDGASTERLLARVAEIADVQSNFFNVALPHRLTIVMLEDADAQRIFGSTNVRGNYRHEMREMVIANVGRSLQHELAHAFHHAHMDELGQEHPIWVQEGLGCLFESYRVEEDGKLEFKPNDRQIAMRYLLESHPNDEAIDVRCLMNCSEDRFKQLAPMYYPMARSLLEFVAAQGDVSRWYKEYTGAFTDDATGETSFIRIAGVPLDGDDGAEARWRKWVVTRDRANVNENNAAEPIRATSRARSVEVEERAIADNADVSSDIAVAAVEIDPEAVKAAVIYQNVRPLVLAGRYADAMPELRKVIEMSPDHAAARYDLALAHIRLGEIDEARAEYEQLKSINENLAAMVLACLERPIRVASRTENVAKPQAATCAEMSAVEKIILPAPPISCEEMRH